MGLAKEKKETLQKEQEDEAVGFFAALYIVPYLLMLDSVLFWHTNAIAPLRAMILYSILQGAVIGLAMDMHGSYLLLGMALSFPLMVLNYFVFLYNDSYLKYQRVLVKEKDTGWFVVATLGVLGVFALMVWLGLVIYERR